MKRVLVTPLDWGLGHATRCIPIIRELLSRNCEVLIAGSGDSLLLLRGEFPSIQTFELPAYAPQYPLIGKMMVWKMAGQLPKFFKTIKKEHEMVEQIIRAHGIDLVISDNRYGCWSHYVASIFITHQNNIMMPKRFGWMAKAIRKLNERYMKKFTECWIPDFDNSEDSLAGKLATFGKVPKMLSARHIGALSRFERRSDVEIKYDVVAIFSGPEPQRTLLENTVYPQLKNSGLKYFVVRGKFSGGIIDDPNAANYLNASELQQLVESAGVVISRSGYSTVMDLAALQKKAIFIPTPGQTEQEYLALTLAQKKIAYSVSQNKFDLKTAMLAMNEITGFTGLNDKRDLLAEAIDSLFGIHTKKPR
jgi:uncharacterized protein (TIGR00661 family)